MCGCTLPRNWAPQLTVLEPQLSQLAKCAAARCLETGRLNVKSWPQRTILGSHLIRLTKCAAALKWVPQRADMAPERIAMTRQRKFNSFHSGHLHGHLYCPSGHCCENNRICPQNNKRPVPNFPYFAVNVLFQSGT